jgi:6-pyruvoyltetrahydropterin/6-carboxytetrahydropterin synthase
MYELEKIFLFEAGHVLKHHDGHCSTPHGHSYVLTIKLRANSLIPNGPKRNMVIDFSDLSSIVKPMIETYFDHKWLNDSLKTDSPTVEFISRWIFDHLHPQLPQLSSVTLQETSTAKVTYFKPSNS